jgi:hypothetical protein
MLQALAAVGSPNGALPGTASFFACRDVACIAVYTIFNACTASSKLLAIEKCYHFNNWNDS